MTTRHPAATPVTRAGRRLTAPATRIVTGPAGRLEVLVTGSGQPSTVFAHGLGGTIDSTRPFGSGVPGRRAFMHFRGYGASDAGQVPWTYQVLGEDLRAVADQHRSTRVLGVSMGAGAVCALLEETPTRFERVVLMLPAVIDRPRRDASLDRLLRLQELSDQADVAGIADHLLSEQPPEYRERPEMRVWIDSHAHALAGIGSRHALRALPNVVPVHQRGRLREVTSEVLVVGQESDLAHPAALARELATLLPRARVVILPAGGVMWGHRARVRALISDFLA